MARDHLCGFRGCGRVRGGRRMCAPEGHHGPRLAVFRRQFPRNRTSAHAGVLLVPPPHDATRRGLNDSIRRPAPPASARAPHPSSRLRGRRAGETMGKAKADAEPKVPKCPPGMDPEYFAMTLVRLGLRRVRSRRIILVFGTVARARFASFAPRTTTPPRLSPTNPPAHHFPPARPLLERA